MSDDAVIILCLLFVVLILYGAKALVINDESGKGWKDLGRENKDSVKEFQENWAREAEIKALKGRMRDVETKVGVINDVLDMVEKDIKKAFKEQEKLRQMIPLDKQIPDLMEQLNELLENNEQGLRVVGAYEKNGKAVFEMEAIENGSARR